MTASNSAYSAAIERLSYLPPALLRPGDFQQLESDLLTWSQSSPNFDTPRPAIPPQVLDYLLANQGKNGILLAFARRLLASADGSTPRHLSEHPSAGASLLRARLGQWLLHSPLHDLYLRIHTHLPAWTQPERQWYAQFRAQAAALPLDASTCAGRSHDWKRRPTISVLLATHGTHAAWLTSAVESVFAQSYSNWELCICDDASGDPILARLLDSWRARDPRVKLHRSATRLGVSAALNQASQLAAGEFVTFLDHDDLLDPAALHVAVEAMQDSDPDLIYTDEDFIDENGRPHRPHFKPGWSPHLLQGCMYLGHLIVMRRELFQRVGGFRTAFDGAQDYDLALRAAEQSPRVAHVPHIAYHWRMHGSSVSKSRTNKPHTHLLGRQAVIESLGRGASPGLCVQSNHVRNLYHIRARQGPSRADVEFIRFPSAAPSNDRDHARLIEELNHKAAHSPREYLLFLEERVEPAAAGSLDVLLGALQRQGVGIAGGKIQDLDGRIVHAGGALGGSAAVASIHNGELASARWPWLLVAREVTCASHAALCVRKATFLDIGGFTPGFPHPYCAADFSLRAWRRGIATLIEPAALFTWRGPNQPRFGPLPAWDHWLHFMRHWGDAVAAGDPYYTSNLVLP